MSLFEPPGGSDGESTPTPPEAAPPPVLPAAPAEAGGFSEFFHTDELPDKPVRSHRGAIEASPFMQRLLAPVTAVVVVVVVIVLLIWINGGSSGTKQSPAAVGPARTHHATPAPASAVTSPATSPATSHAATPTPKVHGIPVKPGAGHASRTATPVAPTAMAPVTVLNNSRRTGLAAAVAAELRGRKWKVAKVGNQTHVIPVTTVYYAPGQHSAAVHLAHDFSSVQRVAPNGAAGVHGSGLTLVVTQSWVL